MSKKLEVSVLSELLNASLSVSNINFNSMSAKMSLKNNLPHIMLNYNNGAIAEGPYSMLEVVPMDALIVKRAVVDTLDQIDLEKLCMNLESSALLIDVAYNACNGIYEGNAHKNLYRLRVNVYDAVIESSALANKFKIASNAIIENLLYAYEQLSSVDNLDIYDLKFYLKRTREVATGMSRAAKDLSAKFDNLKQQTFKEGENVVEVGSKNLKERDLLVKNLADFRAQLDAFNVSKVQLEKQIADAQKLYEKYDKEARALDDKANTMEIIGTVIGGIGTIAQGVGNAMSGYYGASTPKININSNPSSPSEKPKEKEAAPPTPDVVAREKRLGENKAELDILELRIKDYPLQLEKFEKEKQENGRAADLVEKDIKAVKENQEKDSLRKKVLENEISADESYLRAKLLSASGAAIGDVSKELEERLSNLGNNARSAAAAKDKLAEQMLSLKFELENKNTENLARIAEFTGKIKNTNINIIDTEVVINSLQLAVTCLSTVGSTLATVAMFWESIEAACANLSDDVALSALERKIEAKEEHLAELVKYATTNTQFNRQWFTMASKWQALYMVFEAYLISSNEAKKTLDISFLRPEDDPRKHWKLAQELAASLEEALQVTLRTSQSKNEDFKKRVELAQKAKEKMLEEFF